jgi:hypothetical protein
MVLRSRNNLSPTKSRFIKELLSGVTETGFLEETRFLSSPTGQKPGFFKKPGFLIVPTAIIVQHLIIAILDERQPKGSRCHRR